MNILLYNYVKRYFTIAGFISIPVTTINMLLISENRKNKYNDMMYIMSGLSKTMIYSSIFPYMIYQMKNERFREDFMNPEKNIIDMFSSKRKQ